MLFITYFLGPTMVIVLWWIILRKLVRIKVNHHITSIADFIAARYDKSELLAAMATIAALIGIIPYFALQEKAVLSTFAIITVPQVDGSGWLNEQVNLIVVLLMIVFTIAFGVRRLDPTERHEGMVMALAVECFVKLFCLLAAGIFVTYFIYDGFGDIFQRLSKSEFRHLMSMCGTSDNPYMVWGTYMLLSMSAIMFLPRQFHVAVVENSDEKHILTTMWLLPLYLLLINIFVFPIAIGGLLQGYPADTADTFVLQLPLDRGQPWVAMLVFIGGFSAAIGMVMIGAMTLSTMVTNHLLLPAIRWIKCLSFLRRHLLQCKWAIVAIVILLGYEFELHVGESYMLVNIGMISFAAVLQFAPVIIGGIFWRQGNKYGAFMGLSAGISVWFYTLLLPSFIRSGWLSFDLLAKGPFGIAFLRPEQLFGLTGLNYLTHTVFWSLLLNIGLYVLGSLIFSQTPEERELAKEFVGILETTTDLSLPSHKENTIDISDKRRGVEKILSQYFTGKEVNDYMNACFDKLDLTGKNKISITDLIRLTNEVEKILSGSIGSAAAHKAMVQGAVLSSREAEDLVDIYREVLTHLRLTPEELKEKIDYYQERETLLTAHAEELKSLNKTLELRIEEQEKVEKALAESERKYRSIFENAPVGIFQTTPEGRFISASPSAAAILGYDSPEQLRESIEDIRNDLYVDPQQRDEFLRMIQKNDMIMDFECRFYRRDHSIIWILMQARTLRDPKGEIAYFEGFMQDISKRKEAQEALEKSYQELEKRVEERTRELRRANAELKKAKEAADEATRAKSDFLANMSHEIRTPMNGVIAATELVLSEKLSSSARHYLKIIHTSAYSLLEIINDILDFSKIEAGKLELENRPFRLNEVVDRVVDMFINKAVEKHIELLVDIDIDIPYDLIGDPLRVKQVLMNLVSNAVKFTPQGGVILIGVTFIEASDRKVVFQFAVKDTGVGIAAEYLPHLFDAFTQADVSTTREYGGTGLGLCISKQLVSMMGGDIWVNSELEKGSEFSFTIPFQRQPSIEKRKLVPPPDIQGLNVLVVDDCPDSRSIMRKILESFHYKVETVASGSKAVKRLRNHLTRAEPVDLVMLDWLMPKMDGIETARIIREELQLTLPIILMTAFGKEAEKQAAENTGINGFLIKPIYASTLFDAIMDAFGKKRVTSEKGRSEITTQASLYRKKLKGYHVLVAEDNLTNQEIARAILENAGIGVDIVSNGEEAVEAIRKKAYNAVFMDIQMPRMDGYQATRIIRKKPEFQSLPIIAMTAHAMKGDREKCLDAGMNDYVSKPIDQNRLFQKLWNLTKDQKKRPEKTVEAAESSKRAETIPAAEAKPAAQTFPPELQGDFPGINIEQTLKLLNISPHAYLRILKGFYRNNVDTMKLIRRAFKKENREKLLQLAHSLKGSAGNIGAEALSDASFALEKACRSEQKEQPSEVLLDKLEKALNLVLDSLKPLVAASSSGEAAERNAAETTPKADKEKQVDAAQVKPLITQFIAALEAADPEKIEDFFNVIKKLLPENISLDIEKYIENYDYDEALKQMKQYASSSSF
jgi:PAS domain S-box-containing protein